MNFTNSLAWRRSKGPAVIQEKNCWICTVMPSQQHVNWQVDFTELSASRRCDVLSAGSGYVPAISGSISQTGKKKKKRKEKLTHCSNTQITVCMGLTSSSVSHLLMSSVDWLSFSSSPWKIWSNTVRRRRRRRRRRRQERDIICDLEVQEEEWATSGNNKKLHRTPWNLKILIFNSENCPNWSSHSPIKQL